MNAEAGRTERLDRAPANRATLPRNARGRSILSNPAFADRLSNRPSARAFARATFRGAFAAHRFRGSRGFVIGWAGPVFWPYFYDDFLEYTFWPYAYDSFWPYAYDDVYAGLFGPGAAYANVPHGGRRGRANARLPEGGVAQVCAEQPLALTDWPVDRVAQAIDATDGQRAALNALKDATAKAIEQLRSACPETLPSTPTGRLAAMRTRLEAMQMAVEGVRPALDKFYQSLDDEQKARFNALAGEQPSTTTADRGRRSRSARDLSQICNSAGVSLPTSRLAQALDPTEAQRTALDDLDAAAHKAADQLNSSCPQGQFLTPTGRIEAMAARLRAALQALDTVQPALERFYNSLDDEQKARFNQLTPRTG